jgi:energy-converting hydrogenase Eha subunit H
MGFSILLLVLALLLWAAAIKCIIGCDWILVSGVNTLPKEEKQKYKEQHDMVAMNRYIGKRMLLPMAVVCSLYAAVMLIDTDLFRTVWFGTVIFVTTVAAMGLCFSAVVKVMGDMFKK